MSSCLHHYVLDSEHVRHRSCQRCGDVQRQDDAGVWRPVEGQPELPPTGNAIRAAREARKWSRERLAQRAGVGLQTLVRLENGNPGVSLGNLTAVLYALDMNLHVQSQPAPSAQQPLHPIDLDSEHVSQALRQAVSAACHELDSLFPGARPEKNGISSNFAGLLEDHLRAMLEGNAHAARPTRLPVLGYSQATFGPEQPLPPQAQGWLVQVTGQNQFLEPANLYHNFPSAYRKLSRITDLYSSWSAAAACALQAIADQGHPEAPLTIIPGCWSAAEDDHVSLWSPELAQ